MPRSGSRRSAPARPIVRPPPPAQAPPPPPPPPPPAATPMTAPAQQSGGMMSGLMGTMAQGLAFGTGSSIAHHAVGAAANSLFGGKKAEEVTAAEVKAAPVAATCEADKQMFFECLQRADAEKCHDLFTALQACQDNAKFQG
ncbi:hypothetical protein CTAYLR_007717 [Chrysophaeum taylorii]|uniref:CHCH domain-containing protein n=1 Tax=Chrysophaeum taylorii TaxID=2483200 RepID=A0AAD7XPC5_9STRA|nr:hypothetical protein CTAYLR_007717 [Chrysophaeum taylorii]